MARKHDVSTDAGLWIIKHFIFAVFPVVTTLVAGGVVGWFARDWSIEVVSPQEALSNLCGLLSDVLAFLIGFVMLLLGFASSNTLKTIYKYPATRFEYKINMLVPILYGFLLTAAIVVASAFVDGREVIVLSGRRASMYVAMIAAFIFSIIKCLCCHFKMIASVTKE